MLAVENKSSQGSVVENSRGVALVVDDEPTNRLILKSLLKKSNFEVVEANNGRESIEIFDKQKIDIIFMDVMMPEMDGYEATIAIKERCGDKFVPIIFLTAISDEESLVKCVEVGGDDFLTKPYSKTILISKIKAMERVKNLHEEIYHLYAQVKQDEATAEQIFSRAILAGNYEHPAIRSKVQSAEVFSGDMVLTADTREGEINVLLGDFTGHGLSAALGAMPASSTFRAMSTKGLGLKDILEEINFKLYSLLPSHIFMATQLVRIFDGGKKMEVYNGGMPDLFIINSKTSKVRHILPAKGLPLGIMSTFTDEENISIIDLESDDHVFLISDGLFDARNNEKKYYGEEKFLASLKSDAENGFHIDSIIEEVNAFINGGLQDDDISIVEISCPLLPDKNH